MQKKRSEIESKNWSRVKERERLTKRKSKAVTRVKKRKRNNEFERNRKKGETIKERKKERL